MSSLYKFTLLQEKQKSYYRIELFVVLLHLLTFIVFAVTKYPRGIGISIFGIIVAVVYLVLYYMNKEKEFRSGLLETPIFLFTLFWLIAEVYWLVILVFIFSSFAVISKQKIKVLVGEQDVLYKSFPKRSFKWDTLKNVVLKDGMLTIDFKNNKIIQELTEEHDIDEDIFNQFCQQQLS